MKILLINPPDPETRRRTYSFLPPLGLAYIAALLEDHDCEVKIIDGPVLSFRNGYNFVELQEDLKRGKPDVVGVTAVTPNISQAKMVLEISKRILPEAITLLGGPHISAVPSLLNEIRALDYGIFGEGELTVLEFIQRMRAGKKLEDTKGLIYRSREGMKYTPRPFITNLDELPLPARHLLPMKLYAPSPQSYRRLPATAMITSRGCPYHCAFCSKSVFGNIFRPHSPRKVIAEIKHLIGGYGIRDITIYDDTFTFDQERTRAICNEIISKNIDIIWNCVTRVNNVTLDLLKLMKKAGCYEVAYGIESASDRILKMMRKGFNVQQVMRAVGWTKEAKLDFRTFFMLGLPTQTEEDIRETIEFAKTLDADFSLFTLVSPLPATLLHEMCLKKGKMNIGDWSSFTMYLSDGHLPYVPETLTERKLVRLYRQAYREFYFRPSYLIKRLRSIRTITDIRRLWTGIKTIRVK